MMKGILLSLYKLIFFVMLMGNCINEIKLNCWIFLWGGGGGEGGGIYVNIVDK